MLTFLALVWMEFCVLATAWNYGGLVSPALPWLCTIPMLSYYYLRGHQRPAVLFLLLAGLVLIGVHGNNEQVFSINLPAARFSEIYLTSTAFALLFICVISHGFVKIAEGAQAKLFSARAYAEEKRQEAELASVEKSQLLANMSHELRTPLNAIIGFSDIMRGEHFGTIENVQYRGYVADINDSAIHLLELITRVLDYSRIEAGKTMISDTNLCVRDIVETVSKQVKFHPGADRLTIETYIRADIPPLLGDERLLKQILINLLVNAIKFTNAGGRVSLTAGLNDDKGIYFRITDTGIGIPQHDIPNVTRSFFKSQLSDSGAYDGAGLGLAIVAELMKLHGGDVGIESKVGAGTIITCTFPPQRTILEQASTGDLRDESVERWIFDQWPRVACRVRGTPAGNGAIAENLVICGFRPLRGRRSSLYRAYTSARPPQIHVPPPLSSLCVRAPAQLGVAVHGRAAHGKLSSDPAAPDARHTFKHCRAVSRSACWRGHVAAHRDPYGHGHGPSHGWWVETSSPRSWARWTINPWTAPPIWFATFYIGRLMQGLPVLGRANAPPFVAMFKGLTEAALQLDVKLFAHEVWPLLKPMLLGTLPLGIASGIATYIVLAPLLTTLQRKRRAYAKMDP